MNDTIRVTADFLKELEQAVIQWLDRNDDPSRQRDERRYITSVIATLMRISANFTQGAATLGLSLSEEEFVQAARYCFQQAAADFPPRRR